MQTHRFDPKDPNYEGGDPTVMPPISDPNHPDHARWSEEQVYGGSPTITETAPPPPALEPVKRTRAKKAARARKATKKAVEQ